MFFKNKKKINLGKFLISILILSIIATVFMIYRASVLEFEISKKIEDLKGKLKPPIFYAILINNSDCEVCTDMATPLKQEIYKYEPDAEVYIETIDYETEKAKGFIFKYNITKLPVLLVKGEFEKNKKIFTVFKNNGVFENNFFVFKDTPAPYYDLNKKTVRGKFKLIFLVDSNCANCYDVTLHKNALESAGLKTYDQEIIDIRTKRGKDLIVEYDIENIPTILLSGDLEAHEGFKDFWLDNNLGKISQDGTYVFTDTGFMKRAGNYKNINK
jgi:hypothetical protein